MGKALIVWPGPFFLAFVVLLLRSVTLPVLVGKTSKSRLMQSPSLMLQMQLW